MLVKFSSLLVCCLSQELNMFSACIAYISIIAGKTDNEHSSNLIYIKG